MTTDTPTHVQIEYRVPTFVWVILIISVIGLVGLLVYVLLRDRLPARTQGTTTPPAQDLPVAAATPVVEPTAPPDAPAAMPPVSVGRSRGKLSRFRLVVLIVAVLVAVGMPLLVQPPASTAGFIVAVIVMILVALPDLNNQRHHIVHQPSLTMTTDLSSWLHDQRSPLALRRGASLLALVLFGVAAWLLSANVASAAMTALLVLGIALPLFGLALNLNNVTTLYRPTTATVTQTRVRWVALGSGVLALVALALVNSTELALSAHVQIGLMAAGGAGVALGLGGKQTATTHTRTRQTADAQKTLLLLVPIVLLAFGLRVVDLGEAVRAFIDELNFASGVGGFYVHPNIDLLPARVMSFSGVYSYGQAHFVALFGHDLLGLRMLSAIMGALTVPAVYLLGRELVNRRVGLIAALLLATFPPHLHFSRLALNNIADPLFGVLALALLARALRSHRALHFALAGVCLGLTAYFYEGGRLLFPAVMSTWVIILSATGLRLITRLTGRWRLTADGRGLLTTALAAALLVMPLLVTQVVRGELFASRLGRVGFSAEAWVNHLQFTHFEHLGVAVRLLVSKADGSPFYGGATPLLLVYVSAAALTGLAVMLWRPRSAAAALLLPWVTLTIIGNTLLTSSDHSPRFVVVFPALALVAALGVWAALQNLPADAGRPKARSGWVLAIVALLLAAGQVHYYFGVHLPTYNRDIRLHPAEHDGQDAIFRSLDFPPQTQIHLIGDPPFDAGFARVMVQFLNGDLRVDSLSSERLTDEYLARLPRHRDHAFYLEAADNESLTRIRTYFTVEPPQFGANPAVPNAREFVLYYAPADINAATPEQ